MHATVRIAAFLTTAASLSGCVVAALPVAAGGAIATTRGQAAPAPSAQPRGYGSVQPLPTSTPSASAVAPTVEPAPQDRATMVPGRVYAGTLPSDAAAAVPATAPAPEAAQPAGYAGWADLGRFVAASMATPAHSALLARGSDTAQPRWAPCENKPRAVLAAVSLLSGKGWTGAPTAAGRQWIGALSTMGATLVLIGIGTPDDAALKAVATSLGLPPFKPDETVFTATTDATLPGVRAVIATRYCVVAVAGQRGADFPNGLLPATTPPALAGQWNAGWFLFAPTRS